MWSNAPRAVFAGLATALAFAAVTLDVAAEESHAAAVPVRVMPLGDSITGSPGCWRALLWNRLQSAGITDVDFVGTLPAQGCGVSYDGDNEGHGGILATNMADQNQLPAWLSASRPDVVIMHLGTNDIWNNRSPATILAAFGKLVDQMRAGNPAIRILVAKIIPMNPSNCAECGARVVALNNAIPGWAAGKSTARSPITVVDQWTGFSTSADTNDGVHPVQSGNVKIADRWFAPLSAAIRSGLPSSPPNPSSPNPSSPGPSSPGPSSPGPSTPGPSASGPSSPPGPSPSMSMPPAPVGCTASYRVTGQWQGGFQSEVVVRNGGPSTSRSWSVGFSFPDGQTITQMWGGTPVQNGARVTVGNVEYNGAIPANGTATFGFIGTWNGTNSAPTPTCTLS